MMATKVSPNKSGKEKYRMAMKCIGRNLPNIVILPQGLHADMCG